MLTGMERSFLTRPVGRSNKRTLLLIAAVALFGVVLGTLARELVFDAQPSRPPDPLTAARGHQSGLRVLFIGNSFTYFNSMPTMVAELAAANPTAPRRVFAVQYAPGGSHLADTARDPALLRLLTSVHWNIVVLQEQSETPALPYWLMNSSLPAVRTLADLTRRDGALPVLFETWAYRHGDLDNFPSDSYAAMQGRLRDGYSYLAGQEHLPVIPVGDAWGMALAQRPSAALWAADDHHPSLEGSYLTAATIYSALDLLDHKRLNVTDPSLSAFTAGLEPHTAGWLREIAYIETQQAFPKRP